MNQMLIRAALPKRKVSVHSSPLRGPAASSRSSTWSLQFLPLPLSLQLAPPTVRGCAHLLKSRRQLSYLIPVRFLVPQIITMHLVPRLPGLKLGFPLEVMRIVIRLRFSICRWRSLLISWLAGKNFVVDFYGEPRYECDCRDGANEGDCHLEGGQAFDREQR